MGDWYYYTATGGESNISTPLAGNVVVELYRSGVHYRKVTGTPVGKEFKADFATGDIIFPDDFPELEVNEQIDIRCSNDVT